MPRNPQESSTFSISSGSCTGDNSCQGLVSADVNGYIFVGDGACRGANSCQNIVVPGGSVELSIGDGACTEDIRCKDCTDGIIGACCQNCESDCSGENPAGANSNALRRAIFLSISALILVATH